MGSLLRELGNTDNEDGTTYLDCLPRQKDHDHSQEDGEESNTENEVSEGITATTADFRVNDFVAISYEGRIYPGQMCSNFDDSNVMDNQNDKIKLFGSDEEDEEEVNYDDFKIRPQFQGPHGQQLLELSSQLPKRFKLDERFAEVFEPEYLQDDEDNKNEEINGERKKNIRILESVLGHEVCTKTVDKSMKRQIRFDPDDENVSHLVKTPEVTSDKSKKSKKKKKVEEKVEQTVPISTERYIEVCSDLKDILSTASLFSFSQQFTHAVEDVVENSQNKYEVIEIQSSNKKDKAENLMHPEKISPKLCIPRSRSDAFFITEDDPRLREGIEFFKRPKPLDEIRLEWQARRERVLELFRRKKRSSLRSNQTRVQTMQNKFAVRKQNFKKFK